MPALVRQVQRVQMILRITSVIFYIRQQWVKYFFLACPIPSLYTAIFTVAAFAAPAKSQSINTADLTEYLLAGRVVTMNESFDVYPNGYVWVKNGSIVAVAPTRAAIKEAIARAGAMEADIKLVPVFGDILPGMIDLHNHPEYAIYPLLPITRKYKDRYEWRFYDDDYQRRITYLNTLMSQAQYFDLGLEVGRYGELKALVGGTTSLQGGRTGLAYAREECLLRNIETSPVTSRLAFSRVDIGRDAEEWRRMVEERSKGPMVVHLAEGVGPRMANEFDYIKRSGLLGAELIAVHGVGLTEPQLAELAMAGGKLVWSPLSNFMLYGQTANIDAARRAGVQISLAPDWAPSGSKSILGELKVADLVNKHALKMPFTDRELVEMVTRNPALAMGWQGRLGRLSVGYLADIIVVAQSQEDPYRNLINAIEEDIKMVIVRGQALYGDQALVRRFRQSKALESLPPLSGNRKLIAPNCANTALPIMSVEDTKTRLQQGLNLDAAWVAKRLSIEQFTRDFQICKAGKPADPPTADNANTLLSCRFQLPFERTTLSPLATNDDADFFPRLLAIPHLPAYLKTLPDYYGAKRTITQAPASSR